jgi:hypothetical protein
VSLGASTPHGLALCSVAWWTTQDVAAVLVATHPGEPVLWYNRRLVVGPTLQLLELWARRLLRDGQTFAVLTACELAPLMLTLPTPFES